MHSPYLPPAGKGIELVHGDDGVYVRSKVYEPGAMRQVLEGGYTAYSVGLSRVKKIRDLKAPNGRIVGGHCVEISLVDRGSNPTTKVQIAKSVGYAPDAPFVFLGGVPESMLTLPDDPEPQLYPKAATPTTTKNNAVAEHDAPHVGSRDHWHVHPDNSEPHAHLHKHAARDDHDHESDAHAAEHVKLAAPEAIKAVPPVRTHPGETAHDSAQSHAHLHGDASHAHSHDHADGSAGHSGHVSDHTPSQTDALDSGDTDADVEGRNKSMRLDPSAGSTAPMTSPEVLAAQLRAAVSPSGDSEEERLKAQIAETAQRLDVIEKAVVADWFKSIPHKEGEPESPPKGYPTDRSDYADGANYSWPLDSDARIHSAVSYYNAGKGKDKYAPDEWATIGRKIASAASEAFGGGYALKDGQIETPNTNDKAASTVPTTTKNGIAAALGPTTTSLLFQMLQAELAEDGGTGSEARDIGHLGKSYCALQEFLSDEAADGNQMLVGYGQVPNALKRLHDIACPGIDQLALKSAWPALLSYRDNVAGGRQTLHQLLDLTLTQDAGKGTMRSLQPLGTLYATLARLAPPVDPDPGQTELDLRSAVTALKVGVGQPLLEYAPPNTAQYGSLTGMNRPMGELLAVRPPSIPSPMGSAPPNPSNYTRPYQTDGRARENADGAPEPQLPPQPPSIDASDFARGEIIPGHARPSPSNKADAPDDKPDTVMVNGRRYYTNASKDATIESLRTIHNNLVSLHPEICPLIDAAKAASQTDGYGAATQYVHTPVPATPVPTAAFPALKTVEPDVTKTQTDSNKTVQPDTIKALLAQISEQNARLEALQQQTQENASLLDALAAAPDPRADVYRAGFGAPTSEKFASVAEAQKRERRSELYARRNFLDGWLRAGNADPDGSKAFMLQQLTDELATG